MNRKTLIAASSLLLLLPALRLQAEPTTFVVTPDSSMVTFVSVAPLETFDGTTNQLSGLFSLEPGNLGAGVTGTLTVQMRDLTTGLGVRDNHMKKNHLQTDLYPVSIFVPTAVKQGPDSLASGEPAKLILTGIFTLHGMTRRIVVQVDALWNRDGDRLQVTAKFPVRLADYSIPRPQFLTMRLGEVQQVTVAFTASVRKNMASQ